MSHEKVNGASPHEMDLRTLTEGGYGPFISQGLDRPQLTNQEVLKAMSRVARHLFVPSEVSRFAYEDRALAIGKRQTISQPYIVALMTQEAGISQGSKVLEIGTGSGFQAAVLAELGARVFSVEIISSLADEAKERLERLGYVNVTVRQGDGWKGWEEEAPFDAILVTAAAPRPPRELISQLANGGKMVIPIEDENTDGEILMVIEKRGDDLITRDLGLVRFVPITGTAREREENKQSSDSDDDDNDANDE